MMDHVQSDKSTWPANNYVTVPYRNVMLKFTLAYRKRNVRLKSLNGNFFLSSTVVRSGLHTNMGVSEVLLCRILVCFK